MNLSSIGGYRAAAEFGVYCSTKFAVEGITEAVQAELKPLGIHATIVEPGYFRTDFLDASSLVVGKEVIDDYVETSGTVRRLAVGISHNQPRGPGEARDGPRHAGRCANAAPPSSARHRHAEGDRGQERVCHRGNRDVEGSVAVDGFPALIRLFAKWRSCVTRWAPVKSRERNTSSGITSFTRRKTVIAHWRSDVGLWPTSAECVGASRPWRDTDCWSRACSVHPDITSGRTIKRARTCVRRLPAFGALLRRPRQRIFDALYIEIARIDRRAGLLPP